jgi:seipin
MYNYRILSFLTLTGAFWTVEMLFTAFIWFGLSVYILPKGLDTAATNGAVKSEPSPVKREDENEGSLSDTPRTFPTLTGQPPLHYSSPRVKSEEEDEKPAVDTHPQTAEADDEDEDADFVLEEPGTVGRGFSDSGIGTSMESSAGRAENFRRRASRGRDEGN